MTDKEKTLNVVSTLGDVSHYRNYSKVVVGVAPSWCRGLIVYVKPISLFEPVYQAGKDNDKYKNIMAVQYFGGDKAEKYVVMGIYDYDEALAFLANKKNILVHPMFYRHNYDDDNGYFGNLLNAKEYGLYDLLCRLTKYKITTRKRINKQHRKLETEILRATTDDVKRFSEIDIEGHIEDKGEDESEDKSKK